MRLKATRRRLLGSALGLGASLPFWRATSALAAASEQANPLEREFVDPPQAARPRVWWHWMGGNVSAEGARLDVEWMQRVGIGGVHAFSGGGFPGPSLVSPPVPFMSPPWQEAIRQSLAQARAADMEFGIAGSPGWHVTGGPWVAPADGMKKYVWSELAVRGGQRYHGILPPLPQTTGPFQNKLGGKSKASTSGQTAVIAFPNPALEQPLPAVRWTGPQGEVDLTAVSTGDFAARGVKFPFAGGPGSVRLEATFVEPVLIGAIALAIEEGAQVTVSAELAGGEMRTVARATVYPAKEGDERVAPQQTVAFAPIAARRFRLAFEVAEAEPATALTAVNPRPAQTGVTLLQARFSSGARIDRFEAKAGFSPTLGLEVHETPAAPDGTTVPSSGVIDLTARTGADGALDWTPPAGEWTIVRLGWSLTGAVNGPAEPLATGLEVDKFDPAAVRRYLGRYLDQYEQATGRKPGPQGIQSLLTDSWESRVQNWTPAMLKEFKRRRGYDAARFLPVLTGRVVDSSALSERFLFDFRQTLKDLLADNHYGVLAAELKARGMQYYSEALGDNARAIGDGMTIKARADIPTAEYWYRAFATVEGQPPLKADLEEAASAAHVYGKRLVAAEALTVAALNDAWAFSPAMLKPIADEIFARGVNRILLHESHHQPVPSAKPGLQLFLWGQYFNRNDTWAEHAAPWVTYLARTSHMLQQGTFVADVAYFYGEEHNLTELFLHRFNTDVPPGYKYDYINPEALLELLTVRGGRLVTPGGMSYAVLYLPAHVRRFSLPVIRKLRALVRAGAVIVGSKPVGGLGLMSPDEPVMRIADELWGSGQGRGRVYQDLVRALNAERIAPDLSFGDAAARDGLLFVHRRSADGEIYFVSNQTDRPRELRTRFRVAGRAPELWRADTGVSAPAGYEIVGEGTKVPLALEAHEALFVVFREPARARSRAAPTVRRSKLAEIAGPWEVSFAPGLGAPAEARFDELISWPQSSDPGIKYFSGAATYRATFTLPADRLIPPARLELDLGDVREIAVVTLNGKRLPTAWKPPYRIDATEAVRPGSNLVEIEVINLWPNRLIGDRQPGMERIAFAPDARYGPSSPLLPSGLLGPVHVDRVTKR